jgi:hypothetical protein
MPSSTGLNSNLSHAAQAITARNELPVNVGWMSSAKFVEAFAEVRLA